MKFGFNFCPGETLRTVTNCLRQTSSRTVDTFLAAMPEHPGGIPPVIVSSSKDRTGRVAILNLIEQGLG